MMIFVLGFDIEYSSIYVVYSNAYKPHNDSDKIAVCMTTDKKTDNKNI